MLRFFDSHCHIHFNAFREDMEAVIARAKAAGVWMLTVGTQTDTSRHGVDVAESHEGVWATVGLHPNHTCEQSFEDEQEFAGGKVKTRCESFDPQAYRELLLHPKTVALGECGLDFYRLPEGADHELLKQTQEREVRAQLDLANEVGKPVVIHCRDAHAKMQEILREYRAAQKLTRAGVIHCFTGTLAEAQRYLDLGFRISFTGVLTFPPRKGEGDAEGLSPLQRVARELPLEKILIETDAPYLSPVPLRGKRNEPAYVIHVAEFLARLKGVGVEEVAKKTFENALELFGI